MQPYKLSATIPPLAGNFVDDFNLLLVELLGSGTFGHVYKAMVTETASDDEPKYFAVKVMPKSEPGSPQAKCQALEISLQKQVADHPSVVTIHKVFSDYDLVYVVMDLCTSGDLNMLMQAKMPALFVGNDDRVKKTFLQIIEAVEHCHARGVAHRDLKPENILIDEEGEHIFLSDFGLSTAVEKCKQFGVGTRCYMSPECFGPCNPAKGRSAPAYSTRANDVWSLGIILLTMTAGHLTWEQASVEDPHFQEYIKDRNWIDYCVSGLSLDALRILKRMLDLDQESRIGLAELKQEVMNIPSFFDPSRSGKLVPSTVEEGRDDAFAPCMGQVVDVNVEKPRKVKRIVAIQRRITKLFRNKAI